MPIDILLEDGDIFLTDDCDIQITDSVVQAVRTRILWLLGEWRFYPEAGMPYFEEVFVKAPDIDLLRSIIRTETMKVEEVVDVTDIRIVVKDRKATVNLRIVTDEDTYNLEVSNYG